MENKKEYILCSAIKRLEPKENTDRMYLKNDLRYIEIGYRHHDIFTRFRGEVSKNPKDQGFYTSTGRFVDRWEGMKIAFLAGQVDFVTAVKLEYRENFEEKIKNLYNETKDISSVIETVFYKLYSEDLY